MGSFYTPPAFKHGVICGCTLECVLQILVTSCHLAFMSFGKTPWVSSLCTVFVGELWGRGLKFISDNSSKRSGTNSSIVVNIG